ncbi:TPA: hypothetical protein ACRZ4F_002916, partial [Vibrio harveyi]
MFVFCLLNVAITSKSKHSKVNNIMNKMTKVASLAVAMAFSGVSNAAIGDYKVVLIHGFQPDQLQTQPSRTQVETEGADYWKDYWMQYADARIDWPS